MNRGQPRPSTNGKGAPSRGILLLVIGLWLPASGWAQTPNNRLPPKGFGIAVGVHAPLNYSLRVMATPHQRLEVDASLGIIAPPFDGAIIGILDAFGVDSGITKLLGRTFAGGLGSQVGVSAHMGRHLIRISGGFWALTASTVSADELERAFRRNANPYRSRPGEGTNQLTLDGHLWQVAAYYGYRLPLDPQQRWTLRLELGLERTVASSFNLASSSPAVRNRPEAQALSEDLDQDLQTIMADYSWVPTLNVLLVWRLVRG